MTARKGKPEGGVRCTKCGKVCKSWGGFYRHRDVCERTEPQAAPPVSGPRGNGVPRGAVRIDRTTIANVADALRHGRYNAWDAVQVLEMWAKGPDMI